MINSVSLKYFYFTVKLGSIRKAAKYCNVSQPAVSQALKKLEHELGSELLIRTHNSTQLTARGKQVFELAANFWQASDDLRRDFRGEQPKSQELRIGINKHYDVYFAEALKAFLDSHPEIIQMVEFDDGDRIRHRFGRGEFDVAFSINFDREDRASYRSEGSSLYLFEDQLGLCCDQDHPLAGKKKVNIKDLAAYGFILPSFYLDPVVSQFSASNLEVQLKMVVNHGKLAAEMMRDTKYLGILAKKSIMKEQLERLHFLSFLDFQAEFMFIADFLPHRQAGNEDARNKLWDFLSKHRFQLFSGS